MKRSQIRAMLLILALISAFLIYTFVQYRNTQRRLEEARLAQSRHRNVYIITASGLRSDHLSRYLYQHIQTPAIDFLLNDSVRFDKAFSTSPESLAAHLSILTGLYPFRSPVSKILEYWSENRTDRRPEKRDSLPLIFQGKKYRTAAFLADPELRIPSLFGRLFETVACGEKPLHTWQSSYSVAAVSKLAREWVMDHKTEHQFLLLNFNEPALPFEPPSPFNRHYANHPYDGEIAALDEQIGLFINMLKSTGLFQRSIVVFTAPFTESLDGVIRTGSLEEVTLKVPLLISAPGVLPRQQLYESQVSLIDIYPTILSLLEWKQNQEVDGAVLFQKDNRNEISREFIFAQSRMTTLFGLPSQFLVRSPKSKYITGNDSAAENPETTRMAAELRSQLKKEGIVPPKTSTVQMDVVPQALMEKVKTLAVSGKPQLALDVLDSFRGQLVQTPAALRLRGDLAMDGNDPTAAANYYRQAFLISKNEELLPLLARASMLSNNMKEARESLLRYRSGNEYLSYDVYSMMGIVEMDSGEDTRFENAIKYLNGAIELNPRSAEAYTERGRVNAALGKTEEAISDCRKALGIDPDLKSANWLMASTLMRSSRKQEAIPYLHHLIELNPEDYTAMLELAALYQNLGNRRQVIQLCQKVMLNSKDENQRQRAKNLIAE
jgi:tetratricopeptide (TPR) repeat protein